MSNLQMMYNDFSINNQLIINIIKLHIKKLNQLLRNKSKSYDNLFGSLIF